MAIFSVPHDLGEGGTSCSKCDRELPSRYFSRTQLRKPWSTCIECLTPDRFCASCGERCDPGYFSNNQLSKDKGESRCKDCVGHVCPDCHRSFDNANKLKMHKQIHRDRNRICQFCGDFYFRSEANVFQHVESGHCTGCPDKAKARVEIYDLVVGHPNLQEYLTCPSWSADDEDIPDLPYRCPECDMSFRQWSQLAQHQDHKHDVLCLFSL